MHGHLGDGMAEATPMMSTTLSDMLNSSIPFPMQRAFARSRQGHLEWWDNDIREALYQSIACIVDGDYHYEVDPIGRESVEQAADRAGSVQWSPLGSWVSAWSALYTYAPRRRYLYDGEVVTGEASEWLDEQYQTASVDECMRLTDQWLRLYGNVCMRPVWHRGQMVLHVIRPPFYRVVQDPLDPSRPLATVILGRDDGSEQTADVFTHDGQVGYFDGTMDWLDFPESERLVVHCADRVQTTNEGYWVRPIGLQLANLIVRIKNDYIDQLGFNLAMQGHGQLVITGSGGAKDLQIGPGSALQLDSESSAGYISPNAPIAQWRDTIMMLVSMAREQANIPEAMLHARASASGAAIVAANAPIAEVRAQRELVFYSIEQRLLRAMLAASSSVAPFAIGDYDRWSVDITYDDPTLAVMQSDLAREQWLLDIGVNDEVDIAMRENPTRYATREEAEEDWFKRNARRNERVTEINQEAAIDAAEEQTNAAGREQDRGSEAEAGRRGAPI